MASYTAEHVNVVDFLLRWDIS